MQLMFQVLNMTLGQLPKFHNLNSFFWRGPRVSPRSEEEKKAREKKEGRHGFPIFFSCHKSQKSCGKIAYMTEQFGKSASVNAKSSSSEQLQKAIQSKNMSSSRFFLASAAAVLIAVIVVLDQADQATAEPGHHHGHLKGADGTACIVKGSYCSCHYCKCEHGWVWCGHKKHGGKDISE